MPYCCTACNKSFRYKVSQRTHKCTAQPPGTVIRQTGDLLQRLLNNAAISSMINNIPHTKPENVQSLVEVSPDDTITKSLDDLVNESCNKMGIDSWSMPIEETVITVRNHTIENVPSPSECMKNLCLTPSDVIDTSLGPIEMETTINTESLKQLLYDTKI